ncbi:hypothetical protein C8R47DRAFT_490934 [Mycena vitilis]|nr:hypothetical protein C8R47DRAFT_490934 [Mycena vitilis]
MSLLTLLTMFLMIACKTAGVCAVVSGGSPTSVTVASTGPGWGGGVSTSISTTPSISAVVSSSSVGCEPSLASGDTAGIASSTRGSATFTTTAFVIHKSGL